MSYCLNSLVAHTAITRLSARKHINSSPISIAQLKEVFKVGSYFSLYTKKSAGSSGSSHTWRRYLNTSPVSWKKNESNQDTYSKKSERRSIPSKTSLRRVSIEAERSRPFINKSGRQLIDPEIQTKVPTLRLAKIV
jgi:hypothetical protein